MSHAEEPTQRSVRPSRARPCRTCGPTTTARAATLLGGGPHVADARGRSGGQLCSRGAEERALWWVRTRIAAASAWGDRSAACA
jgi:hypothetical protein